MNRMVLFSLVFGTLAIAIIITLGLLLTCRINKLRNRKSVNAEICCLLRLVATSFEGPLRFDQNEAKYAYKFLSITTRLWYHWAMVMASVVTYPLSQYLFLKYDAKRAAGTCQFLISRAILLDRFFLQNMKYQIVILGAGFDSRPYRLPHNNSPRVFEVDMAYPQREKRRALLGLGAESSHVTFVVCDFNVDDIKSCLVENGFDQHLPTAIIWEGVAPYLHDEAIQKTLDSLGTLTRDGVQTKIIFDFINGKYINDDPVGCSERVMKLMKRMRAAGTPFVGGIYPDKISKHLGVFEVVSIWGPRELSRLFGLDEPFASDDWTFIVEGKKH